MAVTAASGVAETRLVQVPGMTGVDFAVLSGAVLRVMDRFASAARAAAVIEEARVLCGPLRVVMGKKADYGKCPQGSHWAGI
jgi:hypothetical protein